MTLPWSAAPKSIPNRLRMPDIPKYNGTTDPNEHVTSYTCAIKGNDLEKDEIESALPKKFGETLSKGEMIWYHNLPPNSIDSFVMLVDAFVKAHAGAIKVETRKSNLFKVKQRDNEMIKEFMSRFQMERIDLPPSKIRVEDDQLGASSGSIYPIRPKDRSKRAIDQEPRLIRDQYQSYNADRRGNESGRHPARNGQRRDRGGRGLMSKNGFDRPLGSREAPRLSEYNFNVDAASIVSAIGHIKETKWHRTLQSYPTQRDPNLMRKYHGTHGHMTEDC
ncbi:PREDICTED: uncharacterized protein LOC109213907 [Nicotiana attenuata]|uniref:uncharacterized protein LOC109213907 n=1 Tax=Nicotiana attenuata TaxID=49451 RepID=UPI000905CAB1|nr:PREDICTED: uncharacterized protein LOC109213907 [Nicotiana attenuata]